MLSEESYAQISPTAKLVAYERTFTDIAFAKEIAVACNAEKTAQALAGSLPELLTAHLPGVEMRYKMTNKLLAQQRITQVLELAAGLSPRGLAITEDPQIVYVATDLPEIIGQSQAIAETILTSRDLHRPNLSFRPANVLHLEDLIQATTPFRPNQPIAIVTEGLLGYLTRAEQTMLANNIHHLLTLHHGVWITPDAYTYKELESRLPLSEKVFKATGRNINLFRDQDDREQFFTRAGFTMETHFATEVFEELSLFNYFKISREQVLEAARNFQSLVLTI